MADIFDEDEETLPIGFEQDPEEDEIGIGKWSYADGSQKYSKGDPALAKDLMSKPAGPPPVATNPLTDEEKASVTAATTPTEEEIQALGGASPEPAAQPEPPPAAPPSAGPAEANEAPRPLQAPQLPGARGPARYTDNASASASRSASQNNQQSVSRQGSAQDKTEFEQQQRDIGAGFDAQNRAEDEGAQGIVTAQRDRAAKLVQMVQDKEVATAAAVAQRDARANQVKTKIEEVSSRKTDHNKIWKDKGALGTTLGLLGVALRSLTATKFGGPNTALQSIQEQRKQNLQAQMEDRDSELRGLEKELGSLDAAVPMLEARMRDHENKRIEAMMVDEKSATVLANAKTRMAQNNTEKAKLLADSAKAYYGTIASQQSQGSQQSATEGQEMGRSRLSGAGVGGEGKGPATAADVLKERLAARDLGALERSDLTHDEYQKELTEYREKAGKQNEFRGSLDSLAKELGVVVTKNPDGSVTVSGEPDVDLLPSEKKRKVDGAFARLKRADVMSMTREPSADLQDEFGGMTDRPFWDSEIVPKLQRFYDMQGQLQKDLDGGYNPSVVKNYRKTNDVGNKPNARPVTGRVALP